MAPWLRGVAKAMRRRIIERSCAVFGAACIASLDSNLHSPARLLIELRMAHADLDDTIDRLNGVAPHDELLFRRLKKRRLALRDQIARLERSTVPQEPA